MKVHGISLRSYSLMMPLSPFHYSFLWQGLLRINLVNTLCLLSTSPFKGTDKYEVLQGSTISLLSFFSFEGRRGGVKGRGELLLSNPARTLWTHKHHCSANKHKEKHLHYLTFKEQQKSLITMGTVVVHVYSVAYFHKLQKERQAFTLKLSQPTTKRDCVRQSLKGKKWDLSSVSLLMGL